MHIAIDALKLTQKDKTGTHNYLYNLIVNLSQIDRKNTYIVYSTRRFSDELKKDLFNNNKNFSNKVVFPLVPATQVALATALYKDKPDVLISPWHTIPFLRRSKMKVVSIFHGLEHIPRTEWAVYFAAKQSDMIIAVSFFTKNQLMKKYKLDSKDIRVIYEGVDGGFYKRAEDSEIKKVKERHDIKGNYILYLGSLVLRKNIGRMLHAFSKIVKSHKEFEKMQFVVGGSGPLRSELKKLVKELDIQENVKFLGYVPQSEVPALISGAVFLSFVSISEGFGLPILEAMACGTPVLSTTQGAVPEVARGAALLVDPNSTEDISEGMHELLTEESLRAYYKRAGLDRERKFSWKDSAASTKKVLEEL